MAFLQWETSVSVGVEAVDQEHRALIDAIDQLQTAVERGYDNSRTLPLVARAAMEAQTHFASEEAAMVLARYPGATLHALKHEHMMDQIRAFIGRYSRDTSSLNRHSVNFFRDAMELHIRNDDMNFGRWMQEHIGNRAAQPAEISNDI